MPDITSPAQVDWSFSRKIAFRFFFLFLTTFILCNNNGAFPVLSPYLFYLAKALHRFIPWFSSTALHYDFDSTASINGSGDTSYHYVLLLFLAVLSVFGAVVWSLLDRRRTNYDKMYYWLLVLVRFYLAFTLIMYGTVKVIKLQFPDPSLSRLLQPLGQATPMGLAWTFLGFSKGYNVFMGTIEICSGLLLFRRTIIIGALISLVATVQVMTINYFFDVPVKILSTALVTMSLFILAPHLLKILRFLLGYHAEQLNYAQAPEFKRKWQYITVIAVKYVFIFWTIALTLNGAIAQWSVYGADAPKPALYGVYNVETYTINRKEIPAQASNPKRWKQLIIESSEYGQLKLVNDSSEYVRLLLDANKSEINLASMDASTVPQKFRYSMKDKNKLVLIRETGTDTLSITFSRYDTKRFKLMNRGFHWINEHPYNR
jgi:hypothetical protein